MALEPTKHAIRHAQSRRAFPGFLLRAAGAAGASGRGRRGGQNVGRGGASCGGWPWDALDEPDWPNGASEERSIMTRFNTVPRAFLQSRCAFGFDLPRDKSAGELDGISMPESQRMRDVQSPIIPIVAEWIRQ